MLGLITKDNIGAIAAYASDIYGASKEEIAKLYLEETGEKADINASSLSLENFKILYHDNVPIDFLNYERTMKQVNWAKKEHYKRALGLTQYSMPIIVNQDFEVIDGVFRLEIIRELQAEGIWESSTVPVTVYELDEENTKLARILLNRTGEFARWDFKRLEKDTSTMPDIPTFVDNHPQLQKVIDPFGFFCQKILPEKFFSETELQFPEKIEKPVYKPEIGLVKWAEIQAEMHEKQLLNESLSPLRVIKNAVPVSFLSPTENDFLETYDIEAEVKEYILHMREVAGRITENYDIKRKAEKEAAGQQWQGTRKSPKAVIAALKAEAEAEALIQAQVESSEEPESTDVD